LITISQLNPSVIPIHYLFVYNFRDILCFAFHRFLHPKYLFKTQTSSPPNDIMALGTLFCSENLIYQAFENNGEDKKLLHKAWSEDPEAFAQSNNSLLRPLTLEGTSKITEALAAMLLSVRICLPPDPSSESSRPIPIGFVVLDASPVGRHHRSCTLGISILAPHNGKGYGKCSYYVHCFTIHKITVTDFEIFAQVRKPSIGLWIGHSE
jgi:hypothetical protein